MRYKILVNTISVSRILFASIMVIELMGKNNTIIVPTALFFIICLTDFFDGKLARKFSVESRLGAVLDVAADLYYMMSMTGVLIYIGMLPVWFLVVIGGKFLEFMFSSWYINRNSSSEEVFVSDRLGRKVAAMFYTMPYFSIVVFRLDALNWEMTIINNICMILAAMSMMSSMIRVNFCRSLSNNAWMGNYYQKF